MEGLISPKENIKISLSTNLQLTSLKVRINQIRKILYMLFEDPSSSQLAFIISCFIFSTVALSLAVMITDSLFADDDSHYQNISYMFEVAIFLIFLIEYIIRISSCTAYGQNLKQFIMSPMNIVDLMSLLPFIVELIFLTSKIKGLQVFRVTKFIRVFRVIKMRRFMSGIELLKESVSRSLDQFSFLFTAFLITNFAFAVMIYYCEIEASYYDDDPTTIRSMWDAIWLCLETVTTIGYGDKTPKSVLGRIIASILAFIGNTILLALPIAIIGLDFNKVYRNNQEEGQIKMLKDKLIPAQLTLLQKECKFMNERVKMIQNKNEEMKIMIEKSSKITKEITSFLKNIYKNIDEDQLGSSNYADYKLANIKKQGSFSILNAKANIYQKIVNAKKKIQITSLLRKNIKRQKSDSQSERSVISHHTIKMLVNKRLPKSESRKGKKKQKAILIKSNSLDNENELIKIKNEEYGALPYDFLNEVLVQIEEDYINGRMNNECPIKIGSSNQNKSQMGDRRNYRMSDGQRLSFKQLQRYFVQRPFLSSQISRQASHFEQDENLFQQCPKGFPQQHYILYDHPSIREIDDYKLLKNNQISKQFDQEEVEEMCSPSRQQKNSQFQKSSTSQNLHRISIVNQVILEEKKKQKPQPVRNFEVKKNELSQIHLSASKQSSQIEDRSSICYDQKFIPYFENQYN